ncbi:MAG: endonuclease/exonuclease/phosphatase family protein [Candidatus Methanofastidiosia archaeon]|jgi:endonuclease/exonuclease/phosphatase family metal-dependent hydrolase
MNKTLSPTTKSVQFFITAAAFLFFFESARELLGTTYNMNLATMSINVSILAIFAFLSPVLLIKAQNVNKALLVCISGIILSFCRALMGLNMSVTVYLFCTVAAVVSFGVFLPALIVKTREVFANVGTLAPAGLVCAGVTGAGVDLVFRALGDTFDATLYGMTPGKGIPVIIFLLILAEILGLLVWYKKINSKTNTNSTSHPNETIKFKSYLGIIPGSLFFLYLTILGYPNNAARWVGGPYWLASFLFGAALGGIILGTVVHPIRSFLVSTKAILTGGAVIVLTFFVLPFIMPAGIPIVLLAISLFFLPVKAAGALRYITQEGVPLQKVAKFFLFCGGTLIILLLCSVFSLTYSYVPGAEIFRNKIEIILVIVALIIMAGTFKFRSHTPKIKVKITTPHIVVVILGIFIMAGTWSGIVIHHSTPTPPGDSIVVMTYNIHQGYNTEGRINPWQLLETIRAVNPDILALQESDMNRITSTNVDIVQWLAHKLNMYVYFGPQTRYQIYGVAILSKYPLQEVHTYFLPSIEDQRVLVRADIEYAGHSVSVYSVHMGLSEEDRTEQAQSIANLISIGKEWKILMGDFNSEPGSSQMEQFNTLVDCWAAAGNLTEHGYTSDSLNPRRRIDYILVSSHFTAKMCEVINGAYGSDHLPVWARIE